MKEIELTQGKVALVDDEDYDWLMGWKWCAHKICNTYYADGHMILISGKRTTLKMHRLILQNFDMTFDCDHIDGNGLNNQKSNLRLCTHQENMSNRRKEIKRKTSSRYKGISWIMREKKWRAQVGYNIGGKRKKHFAGYYLNEQAAALAYNEAAKKMFGEYASLNVI